MTLLLRYIIVLCFFSCCTLHSQSIEWQRLHGIQGSYITAITKTSSGAIFVGTPYGIWRTRDTLRTWENVSVGLRDSLIYALAATSDGALLAGTYTGVYRTTDDGKTWSIATPSGTVRYWQYLYAHPNGTCFASSRKKLFRSTNNGKTWAAFADSIVNVELYDAKISKLETPVAAIGKNGRILVNGFYSDDNGKTWQRHKSSRIEGRTLTQISQDSFIISHAIPNRFYFSFNSGDHWNEHTSGFEIKDVSSEQSKTPNEQRISFINDISYFHREHLRACYAQFVGNNEMLYSVFGLGVWKVKIKLSTNPNFYGYEIVEKLNVTDNGIATRYTTVLHKLNDSTFLLGSFGAGLFISKNKGDTWSPVKNFPAQSPIITTFYNDDKRGTMYAGTVDGLFRSMNRGLQWERIDSGFFRPHIHAITITGKGTLIVASFNRCYRRELGKNVWEEIPSLSENAWSLKQLTSVGDSVFATKGTLFFSKDDGKTFVKPQVVNAHSDNSWGGGSILLSYSKHKNVLVSHGVFGLNRTTKGITSWGKLNRDVIYDVDYVDPIDGSYPTLCYQTKMSRFTDDIYMTAGVSVTTYNWESNVVTIRDRPGEWLYGASILNVMSDQKGRPFAATMEGIAFSEKADKNWKFTPPLPGLSIPAMKEVEVDEKGYLYAASVFGGVFRSKEPIIALSSPSLTLPINKAQEVALTTQLKWTAANDAKNYGLQIATDSLFTTIIFEDSSATALLYGELPLKPNTKYFWRVQSRLFGITSPWSEIRSFSTVTVYPSKVTLRQPANKEINRPVTVSLLWNPTTEADSFDVHVASDNAFTITALRDSMIAKREIQLSNLQQGTEYFWRVRGKNRAGYGPWSETWSFTTQSPSGISEDDNSGMSVTVQNNHVILHYGAYSQSVKGIRITDIRGKTILSQTIEQGQSSSDFDMSGMSKGYYVVILDTHTGSIS
ncbi:MAG: fibronectin type III domain-containing protein, partial [Candidatus Kapaibacterium sp.]